MSNTSLQVHAGGVFQTAPPYAKAGGVWNPVRGVFARSGGVWQQLYGFPCTLVAGSGSSGTGFDYVNGYGTLNGSGSPVVMPSGHDAYAFYTGGGHLVVKVSGLASDPGATSLVAVVAGGNLFLESAATYNYSGVNQISTWIWSTAFTFSSGNTYGCSVAGSIATG